MKTGLFFGAFNPVHKGHLKIAEYISGETGLGEVWFVVTPQSPFKEKKEMPDARHRLNMVELATEGNQKLKACDAEFHLPRPSYTINTLNHLQGRYPERVFALLMGEDNLRYFHLWKDYEKIIGQFEIFAYPRNPAGREKEPPPKPEIAVAEHPHVTLCEAQLLPVSSSVVREALKANENTEGLLPKNVYKYIAENGLYT